MNKIKLIFLFVACVAHFIRAEADVGQLIYSNGSLIHPRIVCDAENYQIGCREFEKLAQGQLNDAQWKKFLEYRGEDHLGTCAGQSFVFLLSNPPKQKKLQIPSTPENLQQIPFFQSHNSFHNLTFQQGLKTLSECDAFFPGIKGTPAERMACVLPLIKQEFSQLSPESEKYESLKTLFESVMNFANLLDFEKAISVHYASALAEKQMQLLGYHAIYRQQKSNAEFLDALVEKFSELIRTTKCSDVLISFRYKSKEGKPKGHKILLQFTHQRIFDPAAGVYQYADPGRMVVDLCVYLSYISTFQVEFEPIGPL